MTWFRIDDGFHGHPKVVELSLEAVGLWALSGSWCAQYLTDGFISARTVRRFGGSSEATSELVSSGLWIETDDGWQFKDWSDYQPMKEEVEAERSAARERMKRVRAAKKGVTSPDVRPNDHGTSGGGSPEVRVAPPDQLPPTSSPSSTKKGGAAKRGTRIPEPFIVTAEMRSWAAEHAGLVDVDRSTMKFVNYWRAKTGQAATKLDWPRTWQNWLLSDQEKAEARPKRMTPTERAQQTAAAGRRVGGMQITTLALEET